MKQVTCEGVKEMNKLKTEPHLHDFEYFEPNLKLSDIAKPAD